MNKSNLRKEFTKIRSYVENKDALSEEICDKILNSGLYKNAEAVFCYWPTKSEVDTKKIILTALSDKKKVALPKCTDKDGNMIFYYITSLADLSEGMYGIMEPDERLTAGVSDKSSVCVVPGLAYDFKGYRLGYGKGYYDRFLESFQGISIGVCFEACLINELPINEFDKKVDYIITDKTIYTI